MPGGKSLSWVVAFALSLAAHVLLVSVWVSLGSDDEPASPPAGRPQETASRPEPAAEPSGAQAGGEAKPVSDGPKGQDAGAASQDGVLPSWVDKVAIPSGAEKAKPPAPPSSAGRETGAKPAAADAPLYTVRQGDTLTEIARKDGSTFEELAKLNNTTVKKLSRLMVGQKLKLKNGIQ